MPDEERTCFHIKHRPRDFAAVVGQPEVVVQLANRLCTKTMPHAMMLSGGSGTGKTTVARILATKLDVSDNDYIEMNAANARGIDTIRDIANKMNLRPLGGGNRMYVIDEAHQLTAAAQNSILKLLEDCPKHCYFLLLTSEPRKLIKAIETRCTPFKFNSVAGADMLGLLKSVLKTENPANKKGLKELCERIISKAGGSPRMALVMLQSALSFDDPDERLCNVKDPFEDSESFKLCVLLLKGNWNGVRKQLKGMDEELRSNPEGVRRMVLGYCATMVLSSSNAAKAAAVGELFVDNVYDSGRAGVVLACYYACN